MIGIVVVSHSPALAQAAVDLALQMVGGSPPPIAIAAGAGEGIIGTDATKVASAIDDVASADGVLVFMDLGSAVLSATMALEFLTTKAEVRLSDAPFVEGLIAGIVLAAAGASLDEVSGEARNALEAKRSVIEPQGRVEPEERVEPQGRVEPEGRVEPVETSTSPSTPGAEATVRLINPDGLHSRPAATVVKKVSEFDATVTITDVTTGKGPAAANSLIAIMALGAREGDEIRIAATGPQAAEAVEAIRAMTAEGYGELGEQPVP